VFGVGQLQGHKDWVESWGEWKITRNWRLSHKKRTLAFISESIEDGKTRANLVMAGLTHLGAWRGLPATGRKLEFPLCGVCTFDANDNLAGEKSITTGELC
jgi:hypothetical protein